MALVDLAPLLYPGVRAVKGAVEVRGFTEAALQRAGYLASIAQEVTRQGSALSLEQRIKSSKMNQSQENVKLCSVFQIII